MKNLGHMKYFRTWIDHFAELEKQVCVCLPREGCRKA